ncbi:MAG: TlpA disulfide reductase family protein [Ferruginibacter sp.]
MIKQFVLIAVALPLFCYSQKKSLILKGRLEHAPEKKLYVSFFTAPAQWVMDTILINESGEFFLETYKCEMAQEVDLYNGMFQINALLVAPGFEMTINGDAGNLGLLSQSLTFSGIGACVNSFRKVQSMIVSPLEQFDSTVLLEGIKYREHITDSLAAAVFDHCSDPYAASFKKLKHDETLYGNYTSIFRHAAKANYDTKTYLNFIRNNIPDSIIQNPGKDEDLLLHNYQYGFLGAYCRYLEQLAKRADSNFLKNDPGFILKKIAATFSGNTRDYILSGRYADAIGVSENLDELKAAQQMYGVVTGNYCSAAKLQTLQKKFADKLAIFQGTKPGMVAPGFTLMDQKGLTHSLSDYLGKVIYIDFWASWCGPCRAENPAMKLLYQHFSNNKNLVIIGISGKDIKANWLRAIDEDDPLWLQLLDDTDKMSESYNLNFIPRFAIIDKKGKIVTADAPRPSEKKTIIDILTRELAK